jgi:hypothetical protein
MDHDAIFELPTIAKLAPRMRHSATLARCEFLTAVCVVHVIQDVVEYASFARLLCRAAHQVSGDGEVAVGGFGLGRGIIAAVAVVAAALENVQESEPMTDCWSLAGVTRKSPNGYDQPSWVRVPVTFSALLGSGTKHPSKSSLSWSTFSSRPAGSEHTPPPAPSTPAGISHRSSTSVEAHLQ